MKDFHVLPAQSSATRPARRVQPEPAISATCKPAVASPHAGFAGCRLSATPTSRLNLGARALAADSPEAATPLQDGGAAPQPTAPAAAAGCAEAINWAPSSPVPIDIRADSAVDFANQMDQALGGNPHTTANVSLAPDVTNGKMTAVNLTLDTAIIRPRWAGGRLKTDAELTLIKRVETFIKEHEERHRDISRRVMQQAVCAAVGKPVATAKPTLKKAICDTEPAAQEALDNTEGRITWTKDATGAVVDFGAAGEKHDYHLKGCDPFAPVAVTPADAAKPKATGGEE